MDFSLDLAVSELVCRMLHPSLTRACLPKSYQCPLIINRRAYKYESKGPMSGTPTCFICRRIDRSNISFFFFFSFYSSYTYICIYIYNFGLRRSLSTSKGCGPSTDYIYVELERQELTLSREWCTNWHTTHDECRCPPLSLSLSLAAYL